ncbi:MAG: hypothetical protein FWB86_12850 [Treponema sp.]|nr:hypothetical protein [Treponema sp.]MCL2250440.1 hypothetical protein [Treponema sp.]
MLKKLSKKITLFSFLCFLLIILCTCKTISNFNDPFNEDMKFFPLETGASVYFFANVQEARSILELLPIRELNNNQAKQMLDKTGFAAGALFPKNNSRQFQLAAWGKYPGNADIAFSVNKSWEKMRSVTGQNYWHSAADRLSIAMNTRQAFIAQSKTIGALGDMQTDPFSAPPGIKIPEGFNDFRFNKNTPAAKAPLSLWIGNPASMIQQLFSGIARFPVQQIFISFFPQNENQYEAMIRLQLENASQARGMSAILNIAGGFSSASADMQITSLFLANQPVQYENNLDIKSAVLNRSDIAKILSMFF